jgi:prepilin-type N-terminal cleavage/methylation domain-containing protein
METNHTWRDRAESRRGFTIVECLIGLAISAILLAAVAVAFNASLGNYRENERMYVTMNSARQALTRMTGEIRTAGYSDQSNPDFPEWKGVKYSATPTSRLDLFLANQEFVRYEFRSAEQKLYLVKLSTDPNQSYVLCDHVTNVVFTTTSDNGLDATSVQISLTVADGDFARTLSAAAVVRRIPPL